MLAVDDNSTGFLEAAYQALFFNFRARFQIEFPHVTASVALYREMVAGLVHAPFQVVMVVP